MEQLLLKMDEKSEVKVIAASAFNFRIELVKKVGKDDIPELIDISHCMADRFGSQALLTKTNIPKYFNSETLPFLARLKGKIIGYIIGVPLEYFKQESWSHFDVNLGKKNTLYTYAFLIYSKDQISQMINAKADMEKAALMLDYSEIFLEGAKSISQVHRYAFSKEEKMLMVSKKMEYLLERMIK